MRILKATLFLFCSTVFAASSESIRNDYDCKVEANFALQLFKDRDKYPIVNTMPQDQRMLELVKMHKGTGEELWAMVYADCKGIRT